MASRAADKGQYFTPLPVVDFIWDTLAAWGVAPRPGLRVLDPACGEGIFLRRARERELCGWEGLHGWELDTAARAWWRAAGLPEGRGLGVRDALAQSAPDAAFDVVIGNPPYGYAVERPRAATDGGLERFAAWDRIGPRPPATRCPVEILFSERFARLARPGGWVAVILPEGLFVNARYQGLRDWLLEHLQPRAVVALPRATFGPAGTSAKTAVLFARRRKPAGGRGFPDTALPAGAEEAHQPPPPDDPRPPTNQSDGDPVLLIAPTAAHGRREALEPYLAAALVCLAGGLPSPLAHATALFPGSLRGHPWNPEFWDSRTAEALAELAAGPWRLAPLGRLDSAGREAGFIRYTTYGAVGSRWFASAGTRYVGPRNLTPTGVDFGRQERYVSPGGPNDPVRSRLEEGDILLCNSGVASVGRPAIFAGYAGPANIAQHVNLIRVAGIDPFYVTAYLHTRFARAQLHRFQSGTGAAGINFDQIRALQIPVPPAKVQARVRRAYRGMHALHLAAVAAPAATGRNVEALREEACLRLVELVQRLEALLLDAS
jgi:hypothetical protein